ncbi:hypothetical protein [Sediminibacillus halophilus]|uniref:Uncharacterized protein n=1 Tax=Sediminibacillus halophilus TaxID=482461 RepID=A0A1G9NRN5_9BACI|nr:hypothetical protein [Sediminibacillus halophilus]SDL89266.1 hypothetical protein SAMN05216244_1132 [Sediminibacillus halophilus]
MAKRTLFFEKTPAGFRQVNDPQEQYRMLNQQQSEQQQAVLVESTNFLDRLRAEWRTRQLNTDSLDKLQGLLQTLNTPQIKNGFQQVIELARKRLPKNFLNGVISKMANKDFSELLKNFTSSGDSGKLMEKVLNDPELSKEAFGAMKDMLNDEEKFKSMTKMLSDMMGEEKES